MKKPTLIPLVALPLLVGSSIYIGKHTLSHRPTMLEVPQVLNLGIQGKDTLASVEFEIRNRGGAEVRLHDFATSCACLGVEVQNTGGYGRLDEARLAPGQVLPVRVGFNLHGVVGKSYRGWVRFQTSDANQPEVRIDVLAAIQGHLVTIPVELALFNVAPGQTMRRRVEILDTGRFDPAEITSVVSSDDSFLRVLAVRKVTGEAGHKPTVLGRVVAEVDIAIQACSEPRQLHGSLSVFVDKRSEPTAIVPVSVDVVGAVEVSPKSVSLPRSGQHAKVYAANFLVTSNLDGPQDLRLAKALSDLTVKVQRTGESSRTWMVTVEWAPSAEALPRSEKDVQLVVETAEQQEQVVLTVVCNRE
ncbi:MAG: DUF1573 domain-containing protein [Gemmataceae bacterium]